jgi:hypothetical protein
MRSLSDRSCAVWFRSALEVMSAAKLSRAAELRLAVIGQEPACTLLYNQLLALQGMREPNTDKPLVMLLAGGQSGKGAAQEAKWRPRVGPALCFGSDGMRVAVTGVLWALLHVHPCS